MAVVLLFSHTPAMAACIPLGDKPTKRQHIPSRDIQQLLAWFAEQPVSDNKEWREPRYLQSMAELYLATSDEGVLRAWSERLKASFDSIGKSEYIVTAGMLLTPYAWYLHAPGGDADLQSAISVAIRAEFDRWEPTWDGKVYRFATGRWSGMSQPQNFYAAISRAWLLYSEATGDLKVKERALALLDLLKAEIVETKCDGIAWPYWTERDRIDDVSHGELVANAFLTFNTFGYVDDRFIERIILHFLNTSFVGDNLSYHMAGGKLVSNKGVSGNARCDRLMRLARFSTNLIRKCAPHLGLDDYRYDQTSLIRFEVSDLIRVDSNDP